MEKRFYMGLGILTAFLIFGIVTAITMRNTTSPVAEKLERAAQEALAGELEAGIHLAEAAQKGWQAARSGVAAVADHTPMDEIDGLFAEMEVYARAEDPEHFSACCAQLSKLVKAMADAHALTWSNFL